jgi:hypothetical protein
MALVMALTLIMLLGLAIAGSFASTVALQRAAKLSQDAAVLDAAADRALGTVVGDANAYGLAALRLGESRTLDVPMPDAPEILATVAATRFPGGVLWMVAAVTQRHDTLYTRRVNLVARFPTGGVPPAGLLTRGNLRLRDGMRFSSDTAQDAECAVGAVPAAIVGPGATVSVPAGVRVDTAELARDSAYYYLTQRQIASAPAGVVHVAGDTTIDGGAFNGMLIVDGSLVVHGTFVASGLIVVRGGVDASDGALELRGALLVFATPPNVSTILTAGFIEYSPCVVAHTLRVALSPRVVRLRSWAEFF